jgi:protein gp37
MGVETAIEWTDHTFNPWIGCTKVSDGCKNCYAEAQDRRWRREPRWGPKAARERTSESYWKQPARWDRDAKAAGVRRRVFCASLADVFDDHPSIQQEWRHDLFEQIEATPNLDWLLLTKRPEKIEREWPWNWTQDPLPNVWLGTTVEDQEQADLRIPQLLATPAAVRFLSVEPQLGPIHLTFPSAGCVECGVTETRCDEDGCCVTCGLDVPAATEPSIDWVICGGESGRGARPFNVEWARSLRRQCAAAGVAFFMKQLGAAASDEVNGLAGAALRVHPDAAALVSHRLKDPKGGDIAEFPPDLAVRQFPEVR